MATIGVIMESDGTDRFFFNLQIGSWICHYEANLGIDYSGEYTCVYMRNRAWLCSYSQPDASLSFECCKKKSRISL